MGMMTLADRRRRATYFGLVVVCLVLVVHQGLQGVVFTTPGGPPLPLFLKFRKTGGTSVASTLARGVFASDPDYVKWRLKYGKFCGNYDGHWATLTYRSLGAPGMRLCGGRGDAKLVTLLRHPVPRFVSRLYYELGGRSDLLLEPPFSADVSSWSPRDLARMEAIACDACREINGGHCQWRGGLCDTPQEYLVVLSRLPAYGTRGTLQTTPKNSDARFVSKPGSRKDRRRALARALENLRDDFHVVGVLEELHTFMVGLAKELDWPLEALLYTARKVHVPTGDKASCATGRRQRRRRRRRLATAAHRAAERLAKKRNADRAKQNTSVAWSGVFPLLGWNKPGSKGHLKNDTYAYALERNAEDLRLWEFARDAARRRLVENDERDKFDLLQQAYTDGVIPNAFGYYAFCDWRSADSQHNANCRRCAAEAPTAPCDLSFGATTTLSTVCRIDDPPLNPGAHLTVRYHTAPSS